MDVATLTYGVDTSQVTKGSAALRDHAAAAGTAGTAAQKLNQQQGNVSVAAGKASESLRGQREAFRTLAATAGLVGGPLGQVIGQTGILTIGSLRLSPAIIAGALAFGALTAAVYKAVSAYAALQDIQAKQQGLLNLTGGASGQTVQSINATVTALSKLGGQSVDDIRAAATSLITFRQIGSQAFEPLLEDAVKLANTGIAPLKDVLNTLAKAAADPMNNLEGLESVGIHLNATTKDLILTLAKQGQLLQAQAVLTAALSKQISTIGDTSDTLYGSWSKLTNQTQLLMESWGGAIERGGTLKNIIDGLARGISSLASIDASTFFKTLSAITAPFGMGLSFGLPGLLTGGTSGGSQTSVGTRPPPTTSITVPRMNDDDRQKIENANKIMAVTDAMKDQIKAAGMSEVAQDAYNRAVAAGVLINGKVPGTIQAASAALIGNQFMKQATDATTAQTSALNAEIKTFGMAVGPATAYKQLQEEITQAKIKGAPLDQQQIIALTQQANAVGALTTQLQHLKDAKAAADAVSSTLVDGLFDIATGAKTASQALRDMTSSLLKMMLQASLSGQGAFAGLFGTAQSGGLLGSVFTSIFKGGIGGAGGAAGAAASAAAAVKHGGGRIGGGGPTRQVSIGSMASLPRYHDGLAADERLAVLQTGEEVKSRAQVAGGMRQGGGSTKVEINNYSGQPVQQNTRSGPNGQDIIEVTVGNMIASGKADKFMRGRFGLGAKTNGVATS